MAAFVGSLILVYISVGGADIVSMCVHIEARGHLESSFAFYIIFCERISH